MLLRERRCLPRYRQRRSPRAPRTAADAEKELDEKFRKQFEQLFLKYFLRDLKTCMMCGGPDCVEVWCTNSLIGESLASLVQHLGYICAQVVSAEPFGQFERGYYARIDCQADDPGRVFHYRFEVAPPDCETYRVAIWPK